LLAFTVAVAFSHAVIVRSLRTAVFEDLWPSRRALIRDREIDGGISGRSGMVSKAVAWAFKEGKALSGAMVSRKAKGLVSIRRAFNTVISLMGLWVASVISVVGSKGVSGVAGVCTAASML
jgi:hypothetical protein